MARHETFAAPAPVALCGAVCFMAGGEAADGEEERREAGAGRPHPAPIPQVLLCCGIHCFIALGTCGMLDWLA